MADLWVFALVCPWPSGGCSLVLWHSVGMCLWCHLLRLTVALEKSLGQLGECGSEPSPSLE